MEREETEGMSKGASSPKRKAYRSPSLETFGSVGSLTKTLMLTVGVDGGVPGMSRTG